MKMISKFGGKELAGVALAGLIPLYLTSCRSPAPGNAFIYSEQSLPITINADSNYREYGNRFILPSPGWLHVRCTGELVSAEPIFTRDLDNIELFLDLNNQKHKSFGDNDDHHYTITRWPSKLVIQPTDTTDRLRYAFTEAGGVKRYEVQIPWSSLKYQPEDGRIFGFDCAATDNDTGRKERMLFWHANDAEGFLNTSLYGNLVLQRRANKHLIKATSCPYVVTTPKLDGQIDVLWQHMPIHSLLSQVVGSPVSTENFSAQFRTCWNEKNLFFLVEVKDDVNVFDGNYIHARDYGWIEDSTGKTIWQLNSLSCHNGGAIENRIIDTLIFVKPGTYLARYSTDENHSPERWEAPPPSSGFYGMTISQVRSTKKQLKSSSH